MKFRKPRFFLPKLALLVIVAAQFFACAKIGSIDGGELDKQPPRLDSLRSTRNFQKNFKSRSIELRFDEWLKLEDQANQIVVSPPLAQRPEIVLKGKSVVFEFNEKENLRPNTTYTINFGKSIKDFTEGNVVENLRFVFSTGEFLDSLKFAGQVVDAQTGLAVDKTVVALFDDFKDSAVLRSLPNYLARSDAAGNFTFENLRAGEFRLVAFEEGVKKLNWDGSKRLAFAEKTIFTDRPAPRDTTKISKLNIADSLKTPARVVLRMSRQQADFRISSRQVDRFGFARVVFSRQPEAPIFPKTELAGVKFLTENLGDSLNIWYDLPADSLAPAWSFLLGSDSVKIKTLSRADFLKNKKLTFADAPQAQVRGGRQRSGGGKPVAGAPVAVAPKSVFLRPAQSLLPAFNQPILSFDTARFWLSADTLTARLLDFSIEKDSASPRKLHFRAGATLEKLLEKRLVLRLLPGAMTDFWGGSNSDTLVLNLNFTPAKQLGGLAVVAQKLVVGESYVLQVVGGSVVEAERKFLAATTSQRFEFQHLPAVEYTLMLVEDRNRNGRWDAGNFFKNQQPEVVRTKKTDPLKAGNWDLEVSF